MLDVSLEESKYFFILCFYDNLNLSYVPGTNHELYNIETADHFYNDNFWTNIIIQENLAIPRVYDYYIIQIEIQFSHFYITIVFFFF